MKIENETIAFDYYFLNNFYFRFIYFFNKLTITMSLFISLFNWKKLLGMFIVVF